MKTTALRVFALIVGVTLLAAGCGDDASPADAAGVAECPGDFPVILEVANGEVEIPACPTRVISLSPTATEMLFAVGAGDQVAAVDDASDYPPEAPRTSLSGVTPNVEAIAAEEPDLVVVSNDIDDLIEALGRLGIPVLLLPAADTFDDVYAQIETLGVATGRVDDAEAVVTSMRSEVAALLAEVPEWDTPPTYFHELDDTLYSVTSSTFVGQVYTLTGLENVADPADADGFGYPQLSAEYILDRDPEFVFLADTKCCGQSAETIAARPGWDQLTAVREGRVIELDDDIASRWGPRVVEFLRAVVEALQGLDETLVGAALAGEAVAA